MPRGRPRTKECPHLWLGVLVRHSNGECALCVRERDARKRTSKRRSRRKCDHKLLGVVWRDDRGACVQCRREHDRERAQEPARKAAQKVRTREFQRRRRLDPDEKKKDCEAVKNWYRIPGNAAKVRAGDLRRKYGLTLEDFERMLDEQSNRCDICKKPFTEEHSFHPVVDHDPRLGNTRAAVRSLLHRECNRRLGYVEAWREILPELLQYADRAVNRSKSTSKKQC